MAHLTLHECHGMESLSRRLAMDSARRILAVEKAVAREKRGQIP